MSQLASATVTTGNAEATSSLGRVNFAQGRCTFLKGDYLHYTRHLLYVQVQLELDGAIHGDASQLHRKRPTSSLVKPTFVWRALQKSNPLLPILAALHWIIQSSTAVTTHRTRSMAEVSTKAQASANQAPVPRLWEWLLTEEQHCPHGSLQFVPFT